MSIQVTETTKNDNPVLQSIAKAAIEKTDPKSPIGSIVRGLLTGVYPPVARSKEDQTFFTQIKDSFNATSNNVSSYSQAVSITPLGEFSKRLSLYTPAGTGMIEECRVKVGLNS